MADAHDKSRARWRKATDLVHQGRDPQAHNGFVNTPVYRGSTVIFPTLDRLEKRNQPYTYGRRATPTIVALEEALATLEGGEQTFLVSSGLQAVSTALLAFVHTGDHILVVDSVYQPTRALCDTLLKRLGVETTYYDPAVRNDISELFKPNTRLVFTESPGSLTLEMQDIPAIAAAARARNIWTLTDNTWASPLLCDPFQLGVDVSIQAGTKYLVGHADAMLGAITATARAAPYINRAKEALGTSPGSEETFLALRGLRTLDVRMERHQRSAVTIATWLEARTDIARVIYPALASHPGHDIWKRDFTGASGLLSIVLEAAPRPALAALLDGLELFAMGYSWGGYESLIIPFDPASYRTATPWQAEGPALRLHIGLEDPADLMADLDAGFARLAAAKKNV